MKDFRKFCRPKIKKHSNAGDILLRLKCGETGAISLKEYLKILRFFKAGPFTGQSNPSAGKVVVRNKKLGTTATFDIETYDLVKDDFEIELIIGEKLTHDSSSEQDYAHVGDLICYNSILDREAIFSYSDLSTLDNSWQITRIYDEERESPFVDLGLPSGTLWATMNVGANSITDYGNYYMYGKGSTIYNYDDDVYYGEENPLATSADTAAQVWGGSWHTPTLTQLRELTENTTYEWTTINGVNGGKFTAQNGNYVFFPAAGGWMDGSLSYVGIDGYYWSSSPDGDGDADQLYLNSEECIITAYGYRNNGCSVRGVLDSSNISDQENFAQEGDIICYNSILQRQAIFSYSNWVSLNSDWNATGLYGIETFNIDDEVTEERKVISSNGTTFIIKSEDLSKVNNNWTVIDTIYIPYLFVDLDLPSGLLWATKNLGANTETDYGMYFLWGETEGHFISDNYNFNLDNYELNELNNISSDLTSANDAANSMLGGTCRMPSKTEFLELCDNCDVTWTTINSVAGRLFTSKVDNTKSIFLPANGSYSGTTLSGNGVNGNYWSSSLFNSSNSYRLIFNNGGTYPLNYNSPYIGCSIRAVKTLS